MKEDRLLLPIMNALAAFEVAGRTGSFSKAADILGTSQPSVSRHVANLEAVLGRPLFRRRHNKIEFTEAGKRLHEATALSLGHLRGVIAEMSAQPGPSLLTIGCTHGLAHLWIMPRFSALQAVVTGRELRVVTSDAGFEFDSKEIDFSIRFGPSEPPSPGVTRLFDEEVMVVGAPAFCRSHGLTAAPLEPARLAGVPLVHLDQGEEAWLSWARWFKHFGCRYRPPGDVYCYRNYAFSLQAAVEGKGVALAWRGVTGPYLDNGQLVALACPAVTTDQGYLLAYRPDWQGRPEGRSVIDWFRAEAAKSLSATAADGQPPRREPAPPGG